MSQGVIVKILLISMMTISINYRKVSAGRYFARNRACNLLLPPDVIIYSIQVSSRAECITQIVPYKDACCTIYDNLTRNCTIAQTDRFQLVPNASASFEVGIDSEHFLFTLLTTVTKV